MACAMVVVLFCWLIYSYLDVVTATSTIQLSPASTLKHQPTSSNTSEMFHPICDKYFKDADGDSDLLVIPRKAFYDNRNAWKPDKGNVVVVLVEMSELAHGTISACEINGYYTLASDDLREDTTWIKSRNKYLTHALVFVFCLFVPPSVLINGASVKLIHKGKNDTCFSRVETEFSLVVKPNYYSNTTIERGPDSVVICIPLFGRPQYFDPWLKYQNYLGADMVYIAADPSFSVNATIDYSFLKEALDSGFAKMEVWRNPLGKRVFWHSQLIKYQTCIMQYLGVFQYAFMLDSDDFFNPLLPSHKNLHFYVTNIFLNQPKLATAGVKWLNYCSVPDLSQIPHNGNLTATLKDHILQTKSSGRKALHRIDGILYVGIHTSFTQVKGYYKKYDNGKLAYVAHIRPRKGCQDISIVT